MVGWFVVVAGERDDTATVEVAGIDTDRLYPLALQEDLAGLLPVRRPCTVITSEFGHDGFLLELEQAGAVLSAALCT